MSSRCSCGVIKVSTARCDIPLRLEVATLATCFLDHNAASAPPRRRKQPTFSPHFLRVFEIAPLWKFGDTVCVSNVWVFFGADATLFPSTKLKLRWRQICRHCFKTSTRNADIFFYSPLCPAWPRWQAGMAPNFLMMANLFSKVELVTRECESHRSVQELPVE